MAAEASRLCYGRGALRSEEGLAALGRERGAASRRRGRRRWALSVGPRLRGRHLLGLAALGEGSLTLGRGRGAPSARRGRLRGRDAVVAGAAGPAKAQLTLGRGTGAAARGLCGRTGGPRWLTVGCWRCFMASPEPQRDVHPTERSEAFTLPAQPALSRRRRAPSFPTRRRRAIFPTGAAGPSAPKAPALRAEGARPSGTSGGDGPHRAGTSQA